MKFFYLFLLITSSQLFANVCSVDLDFISSTSNDVKEETTNLAKELLNERGYILNTDSSIVSENTLSLNYFTGMPNTEHIAAGSAKFSSPEFVAEELSVITTLRNKVFPFHANLKTAYADALENLIPRLLVCNQDY